MVGSGAYSRCDGQESSPLMQVVERLKKQKEFAAVCQSGENIYQTGTKNVDGKTHMTLNTKKIMVKNKKTTILHKDNIKSDKSVDRFNKNDIAKEYRRVMRNKKRMERYYAERAKMGKEKSKSGIQNVEKPTNKVAQKKCRVKEKKLDSKKCDKIKVSLKSKPNQGQTSFKTKANQDQVSLLKTKKGKRGSSKKLTDEEKRIMKNKRRMQYYYAAKLREKGISEKTPFGLSVEEKIIIRNKKRKLLCNAKKSENISKMECSKTQQLNETENSCIKEIKTLENPVKCDNVLLNTQSLEGDKNIFLTGNTDSKENLMKEVGVTVKPFKTKGPSKVKGNIGGNRLKQNSYSTSIRKEKENEKRLLRNKMRMEKYYAQKAARNREDALKGMIESMNQDKNITNELNLSSENSEEKKNISISKPTESLQVEVNGVVVCFNETDVVESPTSFGRDLVNDHDVNNQL